MKAPSGSLPTSMPKKKMAPRGAYWRGLPGSFMAISNLTSLRLPSFDQENRMRIIDKIKTNTTTYQGMPQSQLAMVGMDSTWWTQKSLHSTAGRRRMGVTGTKKPALGGLPVGARLPPAKYCLKSRFRSRLQKQESYNQIVTIINVTCYAGPHDGTPPSHLLPWRTRVRTGEFGPPRVFPAQQTTAEPPGPDESRMSHSPASPSRKNHHLPWRPTRWKADQHPNRCNCRQAVRPHHSPARSDSASSMPSSAQAAPLLPLTETQSLASGLSPFS